MRMLEPGHYNLPVRQPEFDPAIAAEGFLGTVRINRLELAKAGSHQPLRRNSTRDQILHNRNGTCRGEIPIGPKARARRSANIRMAIDAERPADFRRNLTFEFSH